MSWKPRIMNDKFISFNIPRAKEGLVSGAGESIMLDRMEVDKSTTTSTGMTNIAEYKNETKPGGSFEAIKDKPGKDNLDIVTNVVLPGSVDAGDVGGELQEGLHGLGSQEMDWSCGFTGPRRRSLVEALRPPKNDQTPAFRKSRKKRSVQDGLVQARLLHFKNIQNFNLKPSDGFNFGPSGGSQAGIERERGLKRGIGDQMEGPAKVKKYRLDEKCPSEPDFCQ